MFNFHKPRTYKSAEGCCICRSKTSSSRFIDSCKFEQDIRQCFDIKQPIKGDMCNACVLLTKRFKRLPTGRKKSWNHMVDSRVNTVNGTKANSKYKCTRKDSKVNKYNNCDQYNKKSNNNGDNFERTSQLKSNDQNELYKVNCKVETFKHTKKAKVTCKFSYMPGPFVSKSRNSRSQKISSLSHNTTINTTQSNLNLKSQNYKGNCLQNPLADSPVQTRSSSRTPTRTQCIFDSRQKGVTKLKGCKRRKCLLPRKYHKTLAFDECIQFFDKNEWQEKKICCGTIYECTTFVELFLIDIGQYKICDKHKNISHSIASFALASPLTEPSAVTQLNETEVLVCENAYNDKFISGPVVKKHDMHNKRQMEDNGRAEIYALNNVTVKNPQSVKTTNNIKLSTISELSTITENIENNQMLAGNDSQTIQIVPCAVENLRQNIPSVSTNTNGHTVNDKQKRIQVPDKCTKIMSKTPHITILPSISSGLGSSTSYQSLTKATLMVGSPAPCTKFSDNSSDSGFDEALLERKSVSPLIPNVKISENVTKITITPRVHLNATKTKMATLYNSNTIQHENGITTILPASSLAASNETAAMKYMQPSKVTITPALPSGIPIRNQNLAPARGIKVASNYLCSLNLQSSLDQ